MASPAPAGVGRGREGTQGTLDSREGAFGVQVCCRFHGANLLPSSDPSAEIPTEGVERVITAPLAPRPGLRHALPPRMESLLWS